MLLTSVMEAAFELRQVKAVCRIELRSLLHTDPAVSLTSRLPRLSTACGYTATRLKRLQSATTTTFSNYFVWHLALLLFESPKNFTTLTTTTKIYTQSAIIMGFYLSLFRMGKVFPSSRS
jgi:hypothetical protein